MQNFIKYVYVYFSKPLEKYKFIKENEFTEGDSYSVEYKSDSFVIKIIKYRREFYLTLYKSENPKNEINLFNLLQYLNKTTEIPKSNYFTDENEIDESYRKQLNYLSTCLYENFEEINVFFSNKSYESKVVDLENFMINKYPNLFKKKLD